MLHDQAFADDLSIVSSCPQKAQVTVYTFEKGLLWARLQAKPQKCVCMGMKKFDPRNEHKVEYKRFGDTVYCPFDPNLEIGGKKMRFIVNADADPESVQSDHFKELGRLISVSLSEDKVKTEIGKRVSQDLEKVDLSGVNGPSKLWLYEHFVVSKLSWVFLVHDLSVSFAQGLDKKVIPRLKSWAGLFRSSDLGTLFRRREHLGLQLMSITIVLQAHAAREVLSSPELQRSCSQRHLQDQGRQSYLARRPLVGPKGTAGVAPGRGAQHPVRGAERFVRAWS